MKIIAFVGKKGVGKNYVSDILLRMVRPSGLVAGGGTKVESCAFAEPFKEFMIRVMGIDRHLIYGSDKDKNSLTSYDWDRIPESIRGKFPGRAGKLSIRDIMQLFGTEIMREMFDMEIWVKSMDSRIRTAKEEGYSYFLITDLRFPNEAAMVKRNGGHIWKVDGPQRGDASQKKDGHATEKGLDGVVDFDYIVYNGIDDGPESIGRQISIGLAGIDNAL